MDARRDGRTYAIAIDINNDIVGGLRMSAEKVGSPYNNTLVKCRALWGERERSGRHYSE